MKSVWLLAATALCTATGVAHATHPPKEPPKQEPPAVTSSAQAEATSTASAEGGAGGSATSSSDLRVKQKRQAPSTFTAGATPTAPCYYVNGWSAAVPGGGGGWVRSKIDKDCVERERARLLIEAGRPDLAVALLFPDAPPPPEPRAEQECKVRTERVLEECLAKQ